MTAMLACLFFCLAATLSADTYEVGPGAGQLPKLASVPWGSLVAGDVVNIHYKPGGYHEIIQISQSGTEQKPIVIRGIANAAGALPILDGQNALTAATVELRSPALENLGVILVTPRKSSYVLGQNIPSWITIESLDIRNALYSADAGISFTDSHGTQRTYDIAACGIYMEMARHLTVRGCEISFCGNGIFATSKNLEDEYSGDLLLERNYLHDNGQPSTPDPARPGQFLSNGFREHHISVEADGVIYQYNRFGPLRAGCHGSMIKDRSAGTVIRYNEVVSTESGDLFSIADPQGGADYLDQKPYYPDAFVYGNLFTLQNQAGQQNVVSFAAANGPSSYQRQHRGTLYFYHNTIVNFHPTVGLFSLTEPYMAGTTNVYEKVDCRNNIFYTESSLQNNSTTASFIAVSKAYATINLGTNWMSPGTRRDWAGHSFGGLINGWTNLLVGDASGANHPHFIDLPKADYHLASGANALDAAQSLAGAVQSDFALTRQYLAPQSSTNRTALGSAMDLGAWESPGLPPNDGGGSGGTPTNSPPQAFSQSVVTLRNQSVAIVLTASDPNNDPLSYLVLRPPAHGVLSGTAPNLTYFPNTGYVGSDNFTFNVGDGALYSAVATVSISINLPESLPPVITLLAPPPAASFTAPATVVFSADASDANGIRRVDFFAVLNGVTNRVGSATTAPYSFSWSGMSLGTYTVWARAFDTTDSTQVPSRTDTTPITITILPVQPVMLEPQVLPGGVIRLRIAATPYDTVQLFYSTDLVHWSPGASAVAGEEGQVEFEELVTGRARFFKARPMNE